MGVVALNGLFGCRGRVWRQARTHPIAEHGHYPLHVLCSALRCASDERHCQSFSTKQGGALLCARRSVRATNKDGALY
jgi:hypothetical protein